MASVTCRASSPSWNALPPWGSTLMTVPRPTWAMTFPSIKTSTGPTAPLSIRSSWSEGVRPACHARPRHQPLVKRASVVQGVACQQGRPQARSVIRRSKFGGGSVWKYDEATEHLRSTTCTFSPCNSRARAGRMPRRVVPSLQARWVPHRHRQHVQQAPRHGRRILLLQDLPKAVYGSVARDKLDRAVAALQHLGRDRRCGWWRTQLVVAVGGGMLATWRGVDGGGK